MASLYLADDLSGLAALAGHWLTDLMLQHQRQTEAAFSIALAGGSTPRSLYQWMATRAPKEKSRWDRILWIWGDERNVPQNHADSNFKLARDAWLGQIQLAQQNVLPIPVGELTASDAADRYEQELRKRLPLGENGFGVIDCVLLGMGDDVHTASLFPNTQALQESHRWVVANFVPTLNCWRVTLTAAMLNSAKNVGFFIAGASKKTALDLLWNGPRDVNRYPAQAINPQSGQLNFFIDRAAMDQLSIPAHVRMVQS